jgi:hypothetical protein
MSGTTNDDVISPNTTGNRGLVDDWPAWVLVALPLLLTPVNYVIDGLNLSSNSLSTVVAVGAFVSLRNADKKAILAAGYSRVPSAYWVLLFPGYLWQRASILGDGKRHFWLAVLAFPLTTGLIMVLDPSIRHRFAGQLTCSDVADDVKDLFNGMDLAKAPNPQARAVHQIEETGYDGSVRSCKGVAMLDGIGSRNLTYTLGPENGQTIIRLRVLAP